MKRLCKNKHWKINKEYNIDKILYFLIDRPDEICIYNNFYWLNSKNEWYRNYNLPAFIGYDGYVYWMENNK